MKTRKFHQRTRIYKYTEILELKNHILKVELIIQQIAHRLKNRD